VVSQESMQLRALLINTPFPFEEQPVPPLGLTYLAATLQESGAEVQILDLLVTRYSPDTIRRKLLDFQPQVVGATCSTLNYSIAVRILRLCKRIDSNVITLIGGPHVSFTATEVIADNPWIDIVVRGESDRTLVELAGALQDGNDLGQVAGITYRNDGAAVTTDSRPLIGELDRLPLPARHLLPLSRYRALEQPCTVITSRGCPFGCIFCSAPKMFGRGVRFRSPELVVNEIAHLREELGFKNVNIVDDTFTVRESHVQTICEKMIELKLDINWSVYSRVDTINPRMLRLMKEAGCSWICFGVESGSQTILDRIKKRITVAQSKEAVKMAKEAGINVLVSFILGLPGEDSLTASQTVGLAKELFSNYGANYGFHILAPMPGTEVCERASDYGIKILTRNWSKYNANRPVAETSSFSADQMTQIVADYEQDINKAWENILERTKAGDTLYQDRVDRSVSQNFVWGMLRSGAIDQPTISRCQDLERLATVVSNKLEAPFEVVQKELSRLVKQGDLVFAASPGKKQPEWHWR